MTDWIIVAAVVLLPFVGIALLRLTTRRRVREETNRGEEVAKGAAEGVVAAPAEGVIGRILSLLGL
jgi:hypothetical protein